MPQLQIDPLADIGAIGATDAIYVIYVMFTNAVVKRRRFPAATSSIWYLLSSFAVINYTHDWTYVFFAALGSFIGAYLTITFLLPEPTYPTRPPGSAAGCPPSRSSG
jgi:uncharacterized membrane protein YhaH (DUF805 family)